MKKTKIILLVMVLLLVSIYVVKAINPTNPKDAINVTVSGGDAIAHGDYEYDAQDVDVSLCESGYIGKIMASADAGYYVKNIDVTFGTEHLTLGEDAGSEHGNFFREWPFTPFREEYKYCLPAEASSTNQVQVNVEFAKKDEIDIAYMNYEGNSYDFDSITDLRNYGDPNVLIEGYMEGDIVLPDDCTANGCVLLIQFGDNYNNYKNTNPEFQGDDWIRIHGQIESVMTGVDACDDDSKTCLILVTKDFIEDSYALVDVGYTRFSIMSSNFIGFDVKLDVENFTDILFETDRESIAFNEDNREIDLTIFYGTKHMRLVRKVANPIINNGANHNGSLREFTNVTGSGYGYNIEYDAVEEVANVYINTYYQDKMTLEFNITNGNENVLGGSVKIYLNRFAFGGNGMQLLEVDSQGRNCGEEHNGNTCDQGVYYSVQYRGVLSAFYVENNAQMTNINANRVTYMDDNDLNLEDYGQFDVYARNKNFTPYAIALFYDEDGMIVETKSIDLNAETLQGGFITKSVFNQKYGNYNVIGNINDNYVFFDANSRVPFMSDVDYFDQHLNETIMHDIVLIGKDEVQEKNIKKIALFLVNGEMEEDDIPSLTYGIGEGLILEIRGEN